MSELDTNIAENYIVDASVAKNNLDANNYVVKSRNITPIIDQQRGNGNYSSSKVIIDAQSFGNTSEMVDWKNAYITLPYRITLSAQGSANTTFGSYDHNLMTALKNNCFVESFKVEQAGRTIVSETSNLSHLINFVEHCTATNEYLETQDCPNVYYPDAEFSISCATSLQGTNNTSNLSLATNMRFNDGLLKRQRALYPLNDLAGASNNEYQDLNSLANEYSCVQAVASPVTSITTSTQVLSDIHFLAVIKISKLSDYFAKHPLTRGLGYKFTFTINQCTSVCTLASTNALAFPVAPTFVSNNPAIGSTLQPAMLTLGNLTVLNGVTSSAASTVTYTLKSEIDTDTTANVGARQSGVIMYVPSYELSDDSLLTINANPIVNRNPFFINSAYYDNRIANASINLQLFSAISNPRALIIVPQIAQSVTGVASQFNPLNPSPAVTDPMLSLNRTQIRVNSKPVLPTNSNYAYQQFIDHTSRIFKLNGGQNGITSGVINFSKFSNNYRYYAFDLTQVVDESQRDVPQMITLESFNNSKVAIDLYVFVVYEASASFDLVKGAVEIV